MPVERSDDDTATLYHLHVHVMAIKQGHTHKRVCIGSFYQNVARHPIPDDGCCINVALIFGAVGKDHKATGASREPQGGDEGRRQRQRTIETCVENRRHLPAPVRLHPALASGSSLHGVRSRPR